MGRARAGLHHYTVQSWRKAKPWTAYSHAGQPQDRWAAKRRSTAVQEVDRGAAAAEKGVPGPSADAEPPPNAVDLASDCATQDIEATDSTGTDWVRDEAASTEDGTELGLLAGGELPPFLDADCVIEGGEDIGFGMDSIQDTLGAEGEHFDPAWCYSGLDPLFPLLPPWMCGIHPDLIEDGMCFPYMEDTEGPGVSLGLIGALSFVEPVEALDEHIAAGVCESICTALLEAVTENVAAPCKGQNKEPCRPTDDDRYWGNAGQMDAASGADWETADTASDTDSGACVAGRSTGRGEWRQRHGSEQAVGIGIPEDVSAGKDSVQREGSNNDESEIEPGSTTAMLRNIPNKYTRDMLVDQLNRSFKGCFDFLYLPIDFKNRCNVGYAFINFCSEESYRRFVKSFHLVPVCQCLPGLNSWKVVEVTPARVHGLDANVHRLRNSPVMAELIEHPEWMPMIFNDDGEPKAFPPPTTTLMPAKLRQKGRRDDNNKVQQKRSHGPRSSGQGRSGRGRP
mmetsp:Transcript_7337/g.18377  ORF Transcript_7337/g.18377 Transcript_7337/m.18377 type:complete len:510 (+) Transcript_7337:91-1620(+)